MKKIKVYLEGDILITNQSEAYSLLEKSNFGEEIEKKIRYSSFETIYLMDNDKIEVYSKKLKLNKEELIKKFLKIDKRFNLKYSIFKDLRNKGYILKTGLKFGADFRVYEKGFKINEAHAKWLVFVNHETDNLRLIELTAKSRVAHSIKKNLLLAIIDEEGDISYYEIRWIKP
jgi:tRNA-intron endonuclease